MLQDQRTNSPRLSLPKQQHDKSLQASANGTRHPESNILCLAFMPHFHPEYADPWTCCDVLEHGLQDQDLYIVQEESA
jgi:hypothetical protein